VQLRYALANSFNIPAVKMLAINGVENFVASSSAFGITTLTDPSRYGLSLTLGGGEVRMTEMAQAFSSFANRGAVRTVQGILKVEDRNKNVLAEFHDINFEKDVSKPLQYPNSIAIGGKRAISPSTAFIISHILQDNPARTLEFGANSELVVPRRTVSVKTGTTDDKRDNWTIGYTPNILTAVWVGNNDNSPMNQYLASGITGAAPIWNGVMSYLLKNQPDLKPLKPDTVVGRRVCSDTGAGTSDQGQQPTPEPGAQPSGSCPTRFEYFISGTNTKPMTIKRETVWVTKDSDKLAKEGDPNAEPKEKTIMQDAYSRYCADCAGDQYKPPTTPTPNP